ncbi:MAG: hypothetical protein HQL28_04485 [Candidatus Omnitrophica bacterium]|nr:hypothetical protein [Candidatus Omnitrophota bacterium]
MKIGKIITILSILSVYGSLCICGAYAKEDVDTSVKSKKASCDKDTKSRKKGSCSKVKYTRSKDGLGALIKLSEARAQMTRSYIKETKNYETLSNAIKSGTIKTGLTSAEVQQLVGEPVIEEKQPDQGALKWVYKDAKDSFASKNKITLLFDSSGKLTDIKSPAQK